MSLFFVWVHVHAENVVGRGGFAKVYRGSLPGGELVAVKKLTAAQGPDRMEGFLSELGHVVNVSHPNIARLVGVGVDGGEHLVFPFSRLGCLSGMLHGSGGAEPMPWEARYRVAVGTARGLEYLHERCARRIVHRDIKPANILLKDNYEPLVGVRCFRVYLDTGMHSFQTLYPTNYTVPFK
jgi:interleukin-1 receptor-associated kinase 1